MELEPKKSRTNWVNLTVGCLFVVLLGVAIWFGFDIHGLLRSGGVGPAFHHHSLRPMLLPDQIEGWMTFKYVNYIFHLPPDYLSSKLAINNPNYPNITLDKYATQTKLASTDLLQSVRVAVGSYQGGVLP